MARAVPGRPTLLSDEAFALEAETLRALSHPKRLMLLQLLGDRSLSVSTLAEALHLSLPNASQHLRVLRDRGIVRAERVGQGVRYRVTNPDFLACCTRVRQVLVEEMRRREIQLRAPPLLPPPPRRPMEIPA